LIRLYFKATASNRILIEVTGALVEEDQIT
jgi:hypothetical protein